MVRYLYTATAVALFIFYGAVVITVNALLQLLTGVENDFQTRQTLATGLGITVVAGPLWWLHWRGLRWQVTQEPTTTTQRHYRTYLAIVAGLAIFASFSSAGASVTIFMRLALGLLSEPNAGWGQGLPWMVAMMTATIFWWLHWQPLVGTGLVAQKQVGPTGRKVTAMRGVNG